jgi:hypothetical protein
MGYLRRSGLFLQDDAAAALPTPRGENRYAGYHF